MHMSLHPEIFIYISINLSDLFWVWNLPVIIHKV